MKQLDVDVSTPAKDSRIQGFKGFQGFKWFIRLLITKYNYAKTRVHDSKTQVDTSSKNTNYEIFDSRSDIPF